MHNGRRQNGHTYSPRHNDRNFTAEAKNIDRSKTSHNIEWCWDGASNFDESELHFYKERYQTQLDITNAKYERNGHKENIKKMNDWRKSQSHCPEEELLYYGSMNNTVSVKILKECFDDYLKALNEWNDTHGQHMHILDWALHQDERGAPHIHLRRVWDYMDTGRYQLGQDKALEFAGVALPNPHQKKGRFNNRKQTFDKMMRDKWISIGREHGIEIETTPQPQQKVGKSLDKYIQNQEKEREQENNKIKKEREKLEKDKAQMIQDYQKEVGFNQISNDYDLPQPRTFETAKHYYNRAKPVFDKYVDTFSKNVKNTRQVKESYAKKDIQQQERIKDLEVEKHNLERQNKESQEKIDNWNKKTPTELRDIANTKEYKQQKQHIKSKSQWEQER